LRFKERQLQEALYQNQWNNNCSSVYSRQMMNSGWRADLTNVVFGLIKSLDQKKSFAVQQDSNLGFWRYAANKKDGYNPACPAKNMSFYFLSLGPCPASQSPDLDPWMPERNYFRDYQ
jgi:hypothetical protein